MDGTNTLSSGDEEMRIYKNAEGLQMTNAIPDYVKIKVWVK